MGHIKNTLRALTLSTLLMAAEVYAQTESRVYSGMVLDARHFTIGKYRFRAIVNIEGSEDAMNFLYCHKKEDGMERQLKNHDKFEVRIKGGLKGRINACLDDYVSINGIPIR